MPTNRTRRRRGVVSALTERQRASFLMGWSRPEQMEMGGFESEQHRREVWRQHRDALCSDGERYGLTPYGYGG
jgi:hypothetical protein